MRRLLAVQLEDSTSRSALITSTALLIAISWLPAPAVKPIALLSIEFSVWV